MAAAKPKSRKMATPRRPRGQPQTSLRDEIIDAALDVAEDWGWYDLRLHHVAERLDVPLAAIRAEFRDVDAIADAWIARADRAMLEDPGNSYRTLPVNERLRLSLEIWLDTLAPRRRVTAQIFRTKLWPVHIHHNLKLVTWTSRTVQWWREAALLDGKGQRRSVEEVGMTVILLSTLALWCCDETEGQARSKAHVARRLARADRLMARVCDLRRSGTRAVS